MIENRESKLASENTWTRYGWIITEDLLPSAVVSSRVGWMGPSSLSEEMQWRLQAGEGVQFQLCDSDEDVLYRGRFLGDHTSHDGFGALDDFGVPESCTYIEYRNDQDEWEQL